MNRFSAAVLALILAAMISVQSQTTTNAAGNVNMNTAVILTKSLNAGKAKVGDVVIARMADHVVAGGKQIATYDKARLIGHVTQVRVSSKDDKSSSLGIHFEKIVIKGGPEIPVNAEMHQFLAPAHNMLNHGGNTVPTSGDNAMARAAGPMTGPNGEVVVPARAPTSQSGPVRAPLPSLYTEIPDTSVETAADNSVIFHCEKKNVLVESDTRINLRLTSATAGPPQ